MKERQLILGSTALIRGMARGFQCRKSESEGALWNGFVDLGCKMYGQESNGGAGKGRCAQRLEHECTGAVASAAGVAGGVIKIVEQRRKGNNGFHFGYCTTAVKSIVQVREGGSSGQCKELTELGSSWYRSTSGPTHLRGSSGDSYHDRCCACADDEATGCAVRRTLRWGLSW